MLEFQDFGRKINCQMNIQFFRYIQFNESFWMYTDILFLSLTVFMIPSMGVKIGGKSNVKKHGKF